MTDDRKSSAEVDGTGYMRKRSWWWRFRLRLSNWIRPTETTIAWVNTEPVTFGPMPTSMTIEAVGIFDAPVDGNLIAEVDLSVGSDHDR
jgi:hypothetical protein